MSHLDRPYFVTMGTYQMAILLLFNEVKELSFNEIEEATKLNSKELEKQIVSLIENKILLGPTVRIFKSIERKIKKIFRLYFRRIYLPARHCQLILILKVNEQNLK